MWIMERAQSVKEITNTSPMSNAKIINFWNLI